MSHLPRRGWQFLLLCCAVAALLLKLALAFWTAGSRDLYLWAAYSDQMKDLGGFGLYQHFPFFNHPPFMVHVLQALRRLTAVTSLPFGFLFRLLGILADIGTLIVLWALLDGQGVASVVRPGLLLFAIAPASIMISGFHGNTDPVMIFFLLLSILLLEGYGRPWLAGAAFGMSLNIKVWPLVFVPAIYASISNRRHRVGYFVAAAAILGAASLPYVLQEPTLIIRRVFGYGSQYGYWGLSRLAVWLGTSRSPSARPSIRGTASPPCSRQSCSSHSGWTDCR
jgi:Gpi18-like mannosyltransferase